MDPLWSVGHPKRYFFAWMYSKLYQTAGNAVHLILELTECPPVAFKA
jgi:hypothetical protein